jgi:exonuclease III
MFEYDDFNINQKIQTAANLSKFYNDVKTFYTKPDQKLSYTILHQNIRSIHSNFNQFLASIGDDINKLDIIIFTEINCKENDVNKYRIEGFKNIAKPRAEGRGGGILLYYRPCFKITVLDITFSSAETLSVKIDNQVTILCIYRPPSLSKPLFIQEISQLLLAI